MRIVLGWLLSAGTGRAGEGPGIYQSLVHMFFWFNELRRTLLLTANNTRNIDYIACQMNEKIIQGYNLCIHSAKVETSIFDTACP